MQVRRARKGERFQGFRLMEGDAIVDEKLAITMGSIVYKGSYYLDLELRYLGAVAAYHFRGDVRPWMEVAETLFGDADHDLSAYRGS